MLESRRWPVFAFLVVLAFGCQSETPQADAPASGATAAPEMRSTAPTLADANSIGLRNAKQPLEALVTGGQPSPEQLAELADAGFTRFISLRPAGEDGAGWEENGTPEGTSFARIPVAGGAGLTRENVEALDALLEGDEDTVLYCASGNRVGALLALRAAWLQDMDPAEALELGRAAGMTRLEPAVAQMLGIGSN